MRWLDCVKRAGELLTDAASVVVVGDRESDIYSCSRQKPASKGRYSRLAHRADYEGLYRTAESTKGCCPTLLL
jgi:hypothetical protein